MADISALVKASGIDAQRTATQAFGMAVEDFVAKPLNEMLKGATGQNSSAARPNDGSWYATSFAHSLANSQFRPKLKFLFRVEFLFKQEVLDAYGRGAEWQRNFSFLVKAVDRPKVDFEYEDVNQYNFRTKALKQIKHRELTMTFVDDVGNNVYEFFRFMMMVHSPITRRSAGASQNIGDAYATYASGSGMEFTKILGAGAKVDYAHRGVIDTDVGNAIQAIKVTQIFLNPSEHALEHATKQVSFFFINPRVVSFDLDDVNHEASEANLFTMQFDYDFMVMSDKADLEVLPPEKSVPPVGSAPGEPQPLPSAGNQKAGGSDPYTSLIAGVLGNAARKITSETIGRKIRQVPGLGSVASNIEGIAGQITRDGILNAGKAVNQAIARPGRDVVSDSTTAGPDTGSYTPSNG